VKHADRRPRFRPTVSTMSNFRSPGHGTRASYLSISLSSLSRSLTRLFSSRPGRLLRFMSRISSSSSINSSSMSLQYSICHSVIAMPARVMAFSNAFCCVTRSNHSPSCQLTHILDEIHGLHTFCRLCQAKYQHIESGHHLSSCMSSNHTVQWSDIMPTVLAMLCSVLR